MKNKYKDLSVNTLIFTISSFGSKFISFFLVPIYTAVLTTGEYGTVDLMTTAVQLLIPVLTLNVQDAVLRFALDQDFNKEDVITVSCRTILLSSVLLIAVLICARRFGIIKLTDNYLLFLFFAYLMGTINNSLVMYLRATGKMKVIGVCGVLNTLVTCIVNILLLLVLKWGVNGYMTAYISGTLVANIGMILFGDLWSDLQSGHWDRRLAGVMFAYGIPLVANSVAWWINNASDRFILTFFCGTAVTGIYSISYKIPTILSMVQGTFYSAWSVSAITEFDPKDSDGFIGDVFTAYTTACILLGSAVMFCNIFIAKIIYSNDFFLAWKNVPLLLIGSVFNGLGLILGCIFTAVKRTRDISTTSLIGAATNTSFNFLLIPWLGAIGAAFGTVVGNFVVVVTRLNRLKNVVQMKVTWRPILSSLVVLCGQCMLATLSENVGIQIPCMLVILLLNRPVVIKLLSMFRQQIQK